MVSKLSGFIQITANFPDDFKNVRIFQMTANFPDDFKTVRIFQMTAIFLDDFKSVRIFQMQMVTTNAANFVWHTNFCLGGRVPKILLDKLRKEEYFWSKTPFFIYFSTIWLMLWPDFSR